jgi:transposase-like protein
MWYDHDMIDFPITNLLDDDTCTDWLERHLHPEGLKCPHCGSADRRLFRAQGHFPAYRCRACEGYYTLLTGTVFEKTRQRAATLVLLLRGSAKGEPTARLARELGLSRKQLHTLRQRIQTRLNATAPTEVMVGTAFEADELYQNAGEKKHAPSRSSRSSPPTRQ